MDEGGIASNRESASYGEYVPGFAHTARHATGACSNWNQPRLLCVKFNQEDESTTKSASLFFPLSSLVCFFLLTFYGGTVFDIETSNWGEVVTW